MSDSLCVDPLYFRYVDGEIGDTYSFMVTEKLYDIMCANGDSGKQIWGTECGPAISPETSGSCVNLEMQGYWADRYLQQWTAWDFTGPLLWWNVRSPGWPWGYSGWGAMDSLWNPRPAYLIWKEWGNGEFHIGEGPDFLYHDWSASLAARIEALRAFADTIRVVFHEREDPYLVDFDLLNLVSPPPDTSWTFRALALSGAGPGRDDGRARPGAVRIVASGNLQVWQTDDLLLADLRFEDADETEQLWWLLYGAHGRVTMDRVQMVGNMAGSGLVKGGVVRIADCLFAGNRWHFDPGRQEHNSAVTAEDTLIVVNTTFHENWNAADVYPIERFDLGVENDCHVELTNCLFTGSPDAGWAGACQKIQPRYGNGPLPGATVLRHCATDQDDWAAGVAAFAHSSNRVFPPDSLAEVVRYVDAATGDFRLRWDSELLDVGDPDPALNDFDLTRSDIGWKPSYQPVVLSGVLDDLLPSGHYRIAQGSATITGGLEAGSVVRVDKGVLFVKGNASPPFVTRLGDVNGPRTSIAGRSSAAPSENSWILIDNDVNGDEELQSLVLEGVLFNYPPFNSNLGPCVEIRDWAQSMDAGVLLDGESVQFQNWTGVSGAGGVGVDFGLRFNNCTGVLRNMAFGLAGGPSFLEIASSRVQVEGCTFTPSPNADSDRSCLTVVNEIVGSALPLLDNSFTGRSNHQAPLLDTRMAIADLRHNRFLDCRDTPLVMSQSVLHADLDARNELRESADFQSESTVATLLGGYLNLSCGQNNFVVKTYSDINPIITWAPSDTTPTPITASWRENFWGNNSCSQSIPGGDLTDPELALLPPWAIPEDNLDECVDALTPANPSCPFEPYTPSELLQNGKLAEQAEDWIEAQDNYRWLLQLHATAKECTEGTLRLKALGLHKEHGPEAYESVRDDLFAGADSSDAIKSFHQAMLQDCGGWCVEARWGNREAAVDTLEAWFAIETDPLDKDTIAMALLEIATYPPQGGLSAASPEALVARSVARQRAVDELFAYKRGQGLTTAGAEVLPLRFEISNLYPNPFNARTTVEYALPRDGRLRVRVYNLLGQLATMAFDGAALAGRHRLVLDGSDWASGLYFVTAEFDGATQVRKMMLIK